MKTLSLLKAVLSQDMNFFRFSTKNNDSKIKKIDGNLTIRYMVIRNFITTSLLQLMISSTLVYIVNNDIYYNLSIFVSLLQILLVIIT